MVSENDKSRPRKPVAAAGIRISGGLDGVSIKTDALGETYFVHMDMFETQDEIIIELDLPGMSPEDIKVVSQDDWLLVEGVKKETAGHAEKINYLCMERTFGPIRRVMRFPVPVNPDGVSAVYREGVLAIRAPKVKERRKSLRTISIKGG
ncbi:MAG: Hsp20/alpha crystallin family protein [Nitrospinae bacterium]|nr:Hsp20/alpha crystallin family protein [Nitrospinota bacterium]